MKIHLKNNDKLLTVVRCHKPFLARGDFCRLLITVANSMDSDYDRRSVGPDLDPNCLQSKSADDKSRRKKSCHYKN